MMEGFYVMASGKVYNKNDEKSSREIEGEILDGELTKLERVRGIGNLFKNGLQVERCCAQYGITRATLYNWCRKEPYLKLEAEQYGLYSSQRTAYNNFGKTLSKMEFSKNLSVTNVQPGLDLIPQDLDGTSSTDPKKKKYGDFIASKPREEIDAAIAAIEANLRIGTPLVFAVAEAGLEFQDFKLLLVEEKETRIKILKAEGAFAKFWFQCQSKCAIEASKRGKLGDFIKGSERRFFQQWGPVSLERVNDGSILYVQEMLKDTDKFDMTDSELLDAIKNLKDFEEKGKEN